MFGKSPKVLRAVLANIIKDASNELSTTARLVVQRAFEHWRELDEHLRWCDRRVGDLVKVDDVDEWLATSLDVSYRLAPLCASATDSGATINHAELLKEEHASEASRGRRVKRNALISQNRNRWAPVERDLKPVGQEDYKS